MLNISPRSPFRGCTKRTGPFEVSLTATAINRNTGSPKSNTPAEKPISNIRFNVGLRFIQVRIGSSGGVFYLEPRRFCGLCW